MEQEKAKTAEVLKRPTEAKEKTVEEPELKESAGQLLGTCSQLL
jgi:hypothetical protein